MTAFVVFTNLLEIHFREHLALSQQGCRLHRSTCCQADGPQVQLCLKFSRAGPLGQGWVEVDFLTYLSSLPAGDPSESSRVHPGRSPQRGPHGQEKNLSFWKPLANFQLDTAFGEFLRFVKRFRRG